MATETGSARYLIDAPTATKAAMDGAWEAIQLLTKDLHTDDHVQRAEVLHAAAEALTRAAWCEVAAARADGASWSMVGDALHMTRQAACQGFARIAQRGA